MIHSKQKEQTQYSLILLQSTKKKKSNLYTKVYTCLPDKPEANQTQFTAMGNFITDYTGEISTKTAGLEHIKMH